jgi:hypothetical protein
MKKGLLIFASISAVALVVLFLLRPTQAPDPGTRHNKKMTDSTVSSAVSPLLLELSNPVAQAAGALDTDLSKQPVRQTSGGEVSSAETTLNIEEALIQRQLQRAKIAAEYSSGDGTLTEANFRRYAEDRYIKRRDLNGDGKVDGFELRASAQKAEPSSSRAAEPAIARER